MSRFSGPQQKGAAREAKEQRRLEALERQKRSDEAAAVPEDKPEDPAETKRGKRRRARKGG
jgi:hypothetical protein